MRFRSKAELERRALQHHAFVPTDNPFQRSARLAQALWRESQGLPIGEHRGRPLGSRLAMPFARDSLANYLTANIRSVVRREVQDAIRAAGKLYTVPRIYNDLLSSQPLAFNLFAELQMNLPLASKVFHTMTAGRVNRVAVVKFEHSPGRGDARYTGDRSAFDVYVEYDGPKDKRGFIGIEVKYHESLSDRPANHRQRYDEIADLAGVFTPASRPLLRGKPLQQIWRDHLLACSLLQAAHAAFDKGLFVFLYPRNNQACARAVTLYQQCLTGCSTFEAWTIEEVVDAIASETSAQWVDLFRRRYLDLAITLDSPHRTG